jgi:hypothetical protein
LIFSVSFISWLLLLLPLLLWFVFTCGTGTRPFTRPLTCNGAALLLTAQLRDISVSQGGSAASLAGLRLGLAVVIAGGSSTSGGAVHKDLQVALPLQLGELVLPNVQVTTC